MTKESKVQPLRATDVAEGRSSIQMMNDRILVKRPGSEDRKSKAGLLIPATAAESGRRCVWAEVAAVGPNVRTVTTGDYVLVSLEAGFEAQIRGEGFLLLREREVHAVASESNDSGTGLYL
ncbi:MAG: co-chaperone GroES [Actinomycetota bacterium]